MTTHTPGPWCILPDVGTTLTPQGYASAPFLIPIGASTYGPIVASVNGNEEESRANARLIAAAPDLLAALEAAVQDVEFAARLTRFDSQRGLHEDASDKLADELDSHIAIYRAAITKAKGVTP